MMLRYLLRTGSVLVLCAGLSVVAAEPEAEGEDSSAGLPESYGKDYLIARSSLSPNKKLAVIYPNASIGEKENDPKLKDCLVTLEPFSVLSKLRPSGLTFRMKATEA